MQKSTQARPTWIARDARSVGFVDRFNVPGLGEVRVMPSETIAKAKKSAAGSLRKAIANVSGKNGQ